MIAQLPRTQADGNAEKPKPRKKEKGFKAPASAGSLLEERLLSRSKVRVEPAAATANFQT